MGRIWSNVFPAAWLPVYILLGVSWLLSPALAHEHYGTLRLISGEEAAATGVGYRMCDVLAAGILLLAVIRFQVPRVARYVGWTLLGIAILSLVDGLFPDTCYIGHETCSNASMFLSAVHDAETVMLATGIASLSIADAIRYPHLPSYSFVAFQLFAAVLVVSGLASQQLRVVLQYGYAFAAIVWLGWYVDSFRGIRLVGRSAQWVRSLGSAWVLLAGIFAILVSLPHVHIARNGEVLRVSQFGFLLDQHGIVAGILLLYIARHLYRGERPAFWLVLAVIVTQLLKFAVVTPQVVVTVLYGLLFIGLLYVRDSFDRNVAQPSWVSRFKDLGVVFGGVLLALIVGLAIISAIGQQPRLTRELSHMYTSSHHILNTREANLQERTEARLRVLLQTLLISLVLVTTWSLFRPRAHVGDKALGNEIENMRGLLERYSRSSEDYFKLWPADKQYFTGHAAEGMIAYRVQSGIAFMLADAIATDAVAQQELLAEFITHARHRGWVVCGLLVPESSRTIYEQAGMRTMQIGSSAVIPVADFQTETAGDKWWRWQRNRARKAGWQYEKLLPPHSPQTMAGLRAVSDAWLQRDGRQEQGFALGYFDESYLQGCTIHALRNEGDELVAFANQLPTFGTVRTATVDLIRFLPDTNGTMPALLLHIIENLDPAVVHDFDLGFVPLARMDNDLARLARRLASNRFASSGLEQFKNKFNPAWQPDFIAYDGDLIDLARIARSLDKLFAVDQPKGVQ